MNRALISVIVPVYNVEEFLESCVDSILTQSYKNIEIILVNDGSTDGSGDICDRYSEEKPDQIRVIHKKNEGLNFARRDGFMAAQGDYVTFVDSDDLVHKQYLERLSRIINEQGVDIVMCGYEQFSGGMPAMNLKGRYDTIVESDKTVFLRWFITGNHPFAQDVLMMTVCMKLFSRRLLELVDWGFSNYRSNEDEFWTMQALSLSENGIAVTPSPMYQYRVNPDSITRAKYSNIHDGRRLNKFEFLQHLHEKSLDFLGDAYKQDLLWRFAVQTIVFLERYIHDGVLTFNDQRSVQKIMRTFKHDFHELTLPDSIQEKIEKIEGIGGIYGYVQKERRRLARIRLKHNV